MLLNNDNYLYSDTDPDFLDYKLVKSSESSNDN